MKIIVKRLLAIALVIVMTFSFGACNKSEENKKTESKETATVTTKDGKVIKVETTKEDEKKSGESTKKDDDKKSDEKKTDDKKTDSKKNSDTKTSKSESSKSSNSGSSSKSGGSNSSTTTTTTKATDENDQLRKQLESTYNITIYYGNENSGYDFCGHSVTRLTDSAKIKDALNSLQMSLQLYPSGFFKEFKDYNMPIKVFLVDYFDVSGLTDSQFTDNFVITLRYDSLMNFTFNHEMMHAIDKYIDSHVVIDSLLNEYSAKNPSGFYYSYYSYDSQSPWYNSSYIFTYNGPNAGNYYFVSLYATSRVTEDRAETFKFMMKYGDSLHIFSNIPIKDKGKIISQQIKTYFNSASGSCYWDRHLS